MKKKVLSIFLALMLCLSLLPTAALAEEAGTAGAGDTLAAEQGEGNTVAEQDEAAAAEAAVFLQKAQRGAQVVRCLRKAPARPARAAVAAGVVK